MIAQTFSGLWYLDKANALQMHALMLPRIRAGIDPLPGLMRQAAMAAMGDDSAVRPKSLSEKMAAAQLTAGEFYDGDGMFNEAKYDLYFYRKAGGGSVAVIPIQGTMARTGYCGGGNEHIAAILEQAALDPRVKAVVLKVNTPGGTVDSTKMLADMVRNFPKPIVVWTPFCASAGYYVASQADEIWMEDQSVSEVGSIGVLMVYVNEQKHLEKEGFDVKIFRSKGSEMKALVNGVEPLSAETEAGIQAQLNACRKEFVGYVRAGRGIKLAEEALTGAMFGAKQAKAYGLIDKVGTLQGAIQRAIQLS